MRKPSTGLNLLDKVMKAENRHDMLRLVKPYLSREKYKALKQAVRSRQFEREKRDCIIHCAERIMQGKI